jgi:hypothetical protein
LRRAGAVYTQPQSAKQEAQRIDSLIRAFINSPENQKQSSILDRIDKNLMRVLSIA